MARVRRRLQGARRATRTQRDVAGAVRRASAAIDERDAAAVRAFFETHFTPYRSPTSDGDDTGLVTGYYEPLLAGSRTPVRRFRVAALRPPDDLLVVDLADALSGAQGQARARPRRRPARRAVLAARRHRARQAHRRAARRSCTSPIPSTRSSCRSRARAASQLADGGVMRVGYADQNGHPFRSVARVLIDRGEMTLATASMQGDPRVGAAPSRAAAALLDENPSYVFFREVPPPPPGSLEARIDGPIGSARRAAARRAHDRRRPARDSARRAGVPRDDRARCRTRRCSACAGAGHRRRDPRAGARAISSGDSATRPGARPAGCASRAGCGCCGRTARRRRASSDCDLPYAPSRGIMRMSLT